MEAALSPEGLEPRTRELVGSWGACCLPPLCFSLCRFLFPLFLQVFLLTQGAQPQAQLLHSSLVRLFCWRNQDRLRWTFLSWFQTQVRKTDLPSSGQSYHSIARVITNLIELILYFRREKCESYMLLVKTMLHCWALNSQKPGRKTSWKGEKQ